MVFSSVDIVLLTIRNDDLFQIVRDFDGQFRTFFHVGNGSDIILTVDIEDVNLSNVSTFASYYAVILTLSTLVRVNDDIVDSIIRVEIDLIMLHHPSCFNV